MTKTKNNRTPESEMRIAALRVAQARPSGYASTTHIKKAVHKYVDLTPEDHTPSKTRDGEPLYCQIVGNVICHQDGSRSLFKRGLAIREEDGLRITDAGRAYLDKLNN